MNRFLTWLFYGRRDDCTITPQVTPVAPVAEPEVVAATQAPQPAPAAPAELTKKQKVAAAIAAAAAVCMPLTASYEGLRTTPYKDPVGISTVCYGETEVAMRVYSKDQCGAMLREALAKRYAPRLIQCVPAFAEPEHKNHFAALLDASYNAGWGAACKSRMARSFNAGLWVTGCKQFIGWYETAKGKRLPGLVRRRAGESKLCLS